MKKEDQQISLRRRNGPRKAPKMSRPTRPLTLEVLLARLESFDARTVRNIGCTQEINLDNLKKLSKLDDEDLAALCNNTGACDIERRVEPDSKNAEQGSEAAMLQSYYRKQRATGGALKVMHGPSRRAREEGYPSRRYGTEYGLQSMRRSLRALVLEGKSCDNLDMVNAHPVMVLALMRHVNVPCEQWAEYVANRRVVLERTSLQKRDVLCLLYSDKVETVLVQGSYTPRGA